MFFQSFFNSVLKKHVIYIETLYVLADPFKSDPFAGNDPFANDSFSSSPKPETKTGGDMFETAFDVSKRVDFK